MSKYEVPKCECDTSYKVYKPKETIIEVVDFGKSYDYSDSKFTFRPKYRNSNDDDRRWCNFDITEIIKAFDEQMVEFYGTYDTAFKDKEECKKYCDWKNKRESNDYIIPSPKI